MSENTTDPIVKAWEDRLSIAEKYRDQKTDYKSWPRYLSYYKGDWKGVDLPVNKIFSYIRTIIPRTYFRDPLVTITSLKPHFEWHARVVESISNYLIRELNLKYEMKKAQLDAHLFGIGIIKCGYDSEFGYNPSQVLSAKGETHTNIGEKTLSKVEYRDTVKTGMPWGLRVDPRDILFPAGYLDVSELPWVAHRIFRPLEDVQEDSKYDEKVRKSLKGGYTRKDFQGRGALIEDSKENFCLIWEIRDAKYKQLVQICEGQLLLSIPDACQVDGLPYKFIVFNPDLDSLWGIPDVKMVEKEQLELNDARSQAAKHRRISGIKFLFAKGALTSTELEKLIGEDVGPGVEVAGDTLQNVVLPLVGHTPQNNYAESQEIERSIRETLGFGSNQNGAMMGSAGAPRTATEVLAIDKGLEIREDERKDIMADTLTSIIRTWMQFCFTYWTAQRVTEVTGPDGVRNWVAYTGDEIKSEYTYKVDPDSGMPVTRALRYQQGKEIFMMLNGDPLVDQIALRKLLLRQTEWIDPSYSVIVAPEQQVMPPDMLAFMKGGPAPMPGNPAGKGPMPGGPSSTGQNLPQVGPKPDLKGGAPSADLPVPVSGMS